MTSNVSLPVSVPLTTAVSVPPVVPGSGANNSRGVTGAMLLNVTLGSKKAPEFNVPAKLPLVLSAPGVKVSESSPWFL